MFTMRRAAWLLVASLVICAGVCAAAEAASPTSAVDDHDHEHAEAGSPTTAPKAEGPAHDDHDEHAHEAETEATAAGTAVEEDHSGHAHEEEGHEEEEAHEEHSGHSHGVDAMGLAEAAAELGSVEAARAEVCSKAALEGYNLGLHIGSIFILLGVSAAGAFLPVILHISSKSSFVLAAVKMGTFFGFGTILATAFIHMLLPAARNLNSPCLPDSWNDTYEAWAYLFVTLSIVFMQLIDYLIEGAYQRYLDRRGGQQPHGEACHEQAHDTDTHTHHAAVVGAIASMHKSKAHLAVVPQQPQHDHSEHGHGHGDVEAGAGGRPKDGAGDSNGEASEDGAPCAVHGEGCNSLISHTQPKPDPSQIVGIYMLEAGIIFHSVLIGVTLGVTSGSSFNTLLVALSFHQFFEGFAIGSAVVDSGLGVMKSCLMSLAYAVTTPTGIAIGIGMRESFNKNAETTLLVEGVFDSISTGILIYVVLVELINPLMTQSAWLRSRRWWVQALCFLSFYGGVTVMAVIGKWA